MVRRRVSVDGSGRLPAVMIRPVELTAIKEGRIDLAFRRWTSARVKVGSRLRTAVGLVEVTAVEQVSETSLTDDDARRAGADSLDALVAALAAKADRPVFRVGLRYAGRDPREELRETLPTPQEAEEVLAGLDRLDRAAAGGPWTRQTLALIDRSPGVRAPDLAAELGRETAEFKTDVRKLKERGLTESLAIGYRLSPRGEAVVDHPAPRRPRERPEGTALPQRIGAPATRALRAEGVESLEQVATWNAADLRALHGVGPMAIDRLRDALADLGLTLPD